MNASQFEILKCDNCGKTLAYIHVSVSCENITLTFYLNTTGIPLGDYTIRANATIPVDNDPLDNYLSDGIQKVILEFASQVILPLFMITALPAVIVYRPKGSVNSSGLG